MRWRSRSAAVVCAAALLLVVAGAAAPGTARAAAGSGASGPADWPPPAPGTYRPPVDAPVVDPFRAPARRWSPGNRGLEYGTTPGQRAGAVGAGVVTFAGAVGGRLAVTVLHPDGRRSSLTGLSVLLVRPGDHVAQGQQLGLSGPRLHLGVREGDRYTDPARLFGGARRRARLVPVGHFPALGAVA